MRELHKLELSAVLESGDVLHYTCNAPTQEVLDKHGIGAKGEAYGADPREMLLIPGRVYKKYGIPKRQADVAIQTESLLTRLK